MLRNVDASGAGPDEHSRTRLAESQTRILPRLARGDHRDQGRLGVPPRIRPGPLRARRNCALGDHHRLVYGDRRNWRGDSARKRRGIEIEDVARGAAATADKAPEPIAADAIRRHDADASYCHARRGERRHTL
jgi:hypothetical protein